MSRLEECKKISIVSFLSNQGYQPVKIHGGKAIYSSPLHPESNPSFTVFLSSNRWIDYGMSMKSSDILDLVCEMEGCDTKKAIDILVGDEELSEFEPVAVSNEPLISVVKVVDNYIHPSLLLYLKERCIPENIYKRYTKQIHFSFLNTPEKVYFGIGFRNDDNGWEVRNRVQKVAISPKQITTFGEGKTLSLFEGSFNFMSALAYFGIEEFEGTTIVLNGLGLIYRLIPTLNQFEKINCYLDHGIGAQKTMDLIKSIVGVEKVFDHRYLYEEGLDFNDKWIKLNSK